MNELSLREQLEVKIMNLSQNIWEHKVTDKKLFDWLSNFEQAEISEECEQSHALFLLSNFMYVVVQ